MAAAQCATPNLRRKRTWTGTPEVYFAKPIDNSRLVKVEDPQRSREMKQFGVALSCLFLLVMTFAWQHFKAIEYGKRHHQQKQAGQSDSELLHLAAFLWVFYFYQARIVDRPGKVNLRGSGPTGFGPHDWSYALRRRHLCHPSKTGVELRDFLLRHPVPVGKSFLLRASVQQA